MSTQRSTSDLIAELREEAPKFKMVALVVGFEHETKFVFHRPPDDGDMLTELNGLISAGGEPIGLVGITRPGRGPAGKGRAEFMVRALAEYAGEEWVDGYLSAISDNFRTALTRLSIATDAAPEPERN
jgi:hypothetical protein